MYAQLRQHGMMGLAMLAILAAVPVPTGGGVASPPVSDAPGGAALRITGARGMTVAPVWVAFRDGESAWHESEPTQVGAYAHKVRDPRGRYAFATVSVLRTESAIELQRRIVYTTMAETTAIAIPGDGQARQGTRALSPTVTSAYEALSCAWRTIPEARGYVLAHTETGVGGLRCRWDVQISAGWLGDAREAQFVVPDFSEVPGWQAVWNTPPNSTPWQVSAIVNDAAAPPVAYIQ